MAKPVKVRRCRATVTRFDRCGPGQTSRRGISRGARSPASISSCDHLAKGGPDFAILPFTARPQSVSPAAQLPDGTETTSAAISQVGPSGSASRSRIRFNAAVKLVRRVHMYVGLFLTPWVFLYGVSAFLFNHPDAFPDREVRTLGPSEIAATSLDAMPDAAAIASRVVEALNARAGGRSYRVHDSSSATVSRPITVIATGRGREYAVLYDFDSRAVTIRSTPMADRSPQGLEDGEVLRIADPPRERLSQGVNALLGRLGIEAGDASIQNSPDVLFEVDTEGERLRVAYNIRTERLSVLPIDNPTGRLSNRRFLTELHLASGYPSRLGARWFWAIAVDTMAAAMVVWGCSGLLMWWQMKSLRRWGLVTLVVSVVTAAGLATTMHAVLSR